MDVAGANRPRTASQGSTPIRSKDTTSPGAGVVHMAGQQTCPHQRDKTMGEDPPAHDRSLIQVIKKRREKRSSPGCLLSHEGSPVREKGKYILLAVQVGWDEVRWTPVTKHLR